MADLLSPNKARFDWGHFAAGSATIAITLGAAFYFMGALEQRLTLVKFGLENSFELDTYQIMASGFFNLGIALAAALCLYYFIFILVFILIFFRAKYVSRRMKISELEDKFPSMIWSLIRLYPIGSVAGLLMWLAGWALLLGNVRAQEIVDDLRSAKNCHNCYRYTIQNHENVFGVPIASDTMHVAILMRDQSVALLRWENIKLVEPGNLISKKNAKHESADKIINIPS